MVSVEILGVRVDAVTEEDVLRYVRERINHRAPAHIVTVNAEFVVQAGRNPTFAGVLHAASMATPDGAGVVWAMRRRGIHVRKRVGGSDLIWSIARQASANGHSIFFLGGEEGVAAATAFRLRTLFPFLKVAGCYSGTPSAEERAYIVDLIRRSRADILLVAFGAPEQDIWIANTLVATGAYVAMGVGGSFDYIAGRARRAPAWMRDHGLEWLWRLMRQPRRLRRMLALPQFVWLVLTREPPVISRG